MERLVSKIPISIAMATYNGEQYISELLRSLSMQSVPPYELIVTDDRSDDGTGEIVHNFSKSSPFPVQIYHNDTRLGYAKNFLKAASLCQAPLIAFCDQDDIWYPQKLERCERAFEDPNCTLCFHDADYGIDPNQPFRSSLLIEQPVARLPSGKFDRWQKCNGLTQVFRSSIISFSHFHSGSIGLNKPSMPMAHDDWIFFLADLCGRIEQIPDRLLFYRQHNTNLFGIAKTRSRLWHAVERFFAPPDDIFAMDSASLARYKILSQIEISHPIYAQEARTRAKEYMAIHQFYQRRSSMYKSSSKIRGLAEMTKAALTGGYRKSYPDFGSGNGAFLRDLVGLSRYDFSRLKAPIGG